MAKPEVLNLYVRLMLDEYKPANITNIELQTRNDFFNRLPEPWQKYIYKTAISTIKYFPKLAELNKIYDDLVRNKNNKTREFISARNETTCSICSDVGFYEYYRFKGKVLTREEYFGNTKKYFGKCKKYICTCKCNVGQSKENSNHFYRYSDLFPENE